MIKRYILFSLFAITLLIYVIFSNLSNTKKSLKAQLKFTKVITIDELSFSVLPYEDRFLYLKKSINIYPTMPSINKKGFVYAKEPGI